MVTVTQLVVTSVLAGLSVGSNLPPRIGTTSVGNDNSATPRSGRVTLHQVRRRNYRFNGARAVYRTYLKYGVPVPEYIVEAVAYTDALNAAATKRDTGSAAAEPIDPRYDVAYVTPVSLGTPPQTLHLDFGTGSSDLWVFSTDTPPEQVSGQDIYAPDKSTTAELLEGHTWSIRYGDGSASHGNVYTDNVTAGVQCAQQVSSSFTVESEIDGLAGLGFSSLNTVSPKSQLTFFDNAKPQLDSPVFTADLKANKGTTGNISYVPVNPYPGYWTFTASGYGVGSTGTSLLYLPTAIVTAYYRQVQGATNSRVYGGYVFPCSATLPSFTFGIGGAKLTIPPLSSSGIGVNIWGDVALKAAFVVFDGEDPPSIGWATKPLDE
ncbi:hypothetical protein MYCTH_2121130 [Thermothelomyces thermophilus ATCC 42464]|uniref:Peptidase A1 domain-containing protein n=1 Tax=Thermothelomyces thermophilus (strain ATCC 42464 / BCRC 31852 / DSM 1799) TaxID=573729 RepID=G2QNS5_THET4|nr:uncharacterized protein MYCTH_2121130 [Thermothelomyces thermophilus ATCC 42464]AEO61299.1 hypothetical protein MYCTH_2121130 [Thermothelomyces thermophilus ATCC 42464]